MELPSRKRIRLGGFDYSTPGLYFVTIATHVRASWFGTVNDGVLSANDAGEMLKQMWQSIEVMFPGVIPADFVAMPDHLHGIIMLGSNPNCEASSTLSEVIGAFKSKTTIEYGRGVRTQGWLAYRGRLWQRSFQDQIIRTDRSLKNHQDYILGNPGRWSEKHDR